MSLLIEEFCREHIKIESLMNQALAEGISRHSSFKYASALKKIIVDHLDKEDEILYPVLRNAAELDNRLRQMLTLFSGELEEVSVTVQSFFNQNILKLTDEAYREQLKAFCGKVKRRIKKEELSLYKEYDKLAHSAQDRSHLPAK